MDGSSAALASHAAILRAAAPAALLKGASLAGAAVQTALLGRWAGSTALAAYAAVHAVTRPATLLAFSFFVDAAAARLSRALGRRDAATARSQMLLNVCCCLLLGCATAAALLVARQPLFGLMRLQPAVAAQADPLWTLVAAAMPAVLPNLALCGALQGLRHIGLAAALEALQAAVEAGGLYAVLRGWLLGSMPVLQALGILKLAAAAAYSAAGLLAVAWLAPGGPRSSSGSGGGSHREAGGRGGSPAVGRDAEAAAPLLAEWRQEEGGSAVTEQPPAAQGAAQRLWQELRAALRWRHLGSMLRDGGNVTVRSVVVQGSTFLVSVAAARLGQSALAAHQIAQQLWVLPSHLIAGLQTAALVLGGRLAAEAGGRDCEAFRHWRLLARRLLITSTSGGLAVAVGYLATRDRLIAAFTHDAAVAGQLAAATAAGLTVWHLLCLLCLIFAPTMVLTGLIYARGLFAYLRSLQLVGFALVLCPALWAATRIGSLPALWLAKLAWYVFMLLAEAAGVASAL